MLVGPIDRGSEACAAVEVRRVFVVLLPLLRCLDQMQMELAALDVLLEPSAESGPLSEERLVSDLHGSFARGQQARICENGEHTSGVLVPLNIELLDRNTPADDRFALPLTRETKE